MAREQYQFNAHIADIQASRVMLMEGQKEQQYMQQAGQVFGSIPTAYAGSQGVSSQSQVAKTGELQSRYLAEQDIQRMHADATNMAWGYTVHAQQQRNVGYAQQMAGERNADNTILTGGLSAAKDLFKTTDFLSKAA